MYAYFGSKIGYFVSVFQTSPGGKYHTQYRFVSICQVRYYFSQTILNYYKGQGHIISKVKSFQRWNISYSFFDRSIINSFIITFYIINSWKYQLYLGGRQQTMLFQNQQFLNPSPLSSFLSSKFYVVNPLQAYPAPLPKRYTLWTAPNIKKVYFSKWAQFLSARSSSI